MKSRDVMLASLVAGLIVLWLAISPVSAGASSLVGGWFYVDTCTPCSGFMEENCGLGGPFGHPGDYHCTSGPMVWVCIVVAYSGGPTCEGLGGQPCGSGICSVQNTGCE
jgi:hypothetical protein